jgi:hypothetical protein
MTGSKGEKERAISHLVNKGYLYWREEAIYCTDKTKRLLIEKGKVVEIQTPNYNDEIVEIGKVKEVYYYLD